MARFIQHHKQPTKQQMTEMTMTIMTTGEEKVSSSSSYVDQLSVVAIVVDCVVVRVVVVEVVGTKNKKENKSCNAFFFKGY